MKHRVWERVSPELRARVDELIREERRIQALVLLRDELADPPGIYDGIELIHERYAELGVPWVRSTPPLDVEAMAATVAGLPVPPDAIEAIWDEDSFSTMVSLFAITLRSRTETHLGTVVHGTDRPPVERGAPVFPQGLEAAAAGRALAERFEVPFYFPSPDSPDYSRPRWWDGPREL